MAEMVFGREFVDQNCVLINLINANSPMVFDGTMLGALKVYARANQATVISPFILSGAMSAVTVVGTLTQILAEASVGIALTQLCRKGAPVVFGTFASSISMQSGAPTFGTPEPAHVLFGAAQLARRLSVPFRSGGGLCGSKLPDAQAAHESANTLWPTLLGCAITFAIYQLLAKKFITIMGSTLFTSIALSGSAFACIAHFIITSRGFDFSSSPRFFWLAAGTGFFATVLPSFLVNAGLSRISPQSTSMIATISPLITISLAVWILGEPFTLADALGSTMVIAGVGIYALTDRKPVITLRHSGASRNLAPD